MTFREKLSKVEDFAHKYWYVAVIPFMIWGFFLVMAEKQDIESHYAETVGQVYDYTPIVKHPSKNNYIYEFFLEGHRYTGSTTAYLSKGVNEGEYYRIEYSFKNPEHSRMNFDYQYAINIIHDSSGTAIDTVFKEIKKN